MDTFQSKGRVWLMESRICQRPVWYVFEHEFTVAEHLVGPLNDITVVKYEYQGDILKLLGLK